MPPTADTVERGPWTYAALSAATREDHVRREIIDGWLYVDGQRGDDPLVAVASESARVPHQDAVRELLLALAPAAQDLGGEVYVAPLDVRFGEHVLQPDVLWLPTAPPADVLPVEVLPVLVVEVSSPATRRHDLVRKRRVYEQARVPAYWFVDLEAERFECYDLADRTYPSPALVTRGGTATTSALVGLAVDVSAVLGRPAT